MARKVFVSFATVDNARQKSLVGQLRKSPDLDPIVVTARTLPSQLIARKVADDIDACDYFVPILTRASIFNQWVNQEIGYAVAKDKKVLPIVDKRLLRKLKGFIHNQQDLPFTFLAQGIRNSSRPRFETRAFVCEVT